MGEVGFGNFLELRLCLRFLSLVGQKASQGNTQPLAAVAAVSHWLLAVLLSETKIEVDRNLIFASVV